MREVYAPDAGLHKPPHTYSKPYALCCSSNYGYLIDKALHDGTRSCTAFVRMTVSLVANASVFRVMDSSVQMQLAVDCCLPQQESAVGEDGSYILCTCCNHSWVRIFARNDLASLSPGAYGPRSLGCLSASLYRQASTNLTSISFAQMLPAYNWHVTTVSPEAVLVTSSDSDL